MKKKSYNPFKMAGFWIGVILAVIHYILFFGTYSNQISRQGAYFLFFKCSGGVEFLPNICAKGLFALGAIFILPLIGWGIHSLIRRLRR